MSAAEELHNRGVRIEELRAQNAELVAALEEARGWMADEIGDSFKPRGRGILERIDAALAAAGHKP